MDRLRSVQLIYLLPNGKFHFISHLEGHITDINYIFLYFRVNWETQNALNYKATFLAEKSLNLNNTLAASALIDTLASAVNETLGAANNITLAAADNTTELINTTTTTQAPGYDIDEERHKFMYAYAIIMLLVLYLVFQRAISFFCMCLKASRNIHDKLFRGIIRAPMHFFNSNSSGRVMNRFSKDISNIDTMLPNALYDSVLVRICK